MINKELVAVLERQGKDYANEGNKFENFEKMANLLSIKPEQSFIFYLSIKITRLVELYRESKEPSNESVEDTLLDLIGYATLFRAYRSKIKLSVQDDGNRRREAKA